MSMIFVSKIYSKNIGTLAKSSFFQCCLSTAISPMECEMFQAMEAQVDAGRTKAIGLSNFNIAQIKRVLQAAHIPPANLQVELHVLCQQQALVDFCKEHNILVCAYSPLGSRGTAQLYKTIGIRFEFTVIFFLLHTNRKVNYMHQSSHILNSVLLFIYA
jgi:diketogulonate reductase-like aldo/keto reductase